MEAIFLDLFKDLLYILLIMMVSRSRTSIVSFLWNRFYELLGLSLITFASLLTLALLTHVPTDPSWNFVVETQPQNLLGEFGAVTSDLFLQFFGAPSYVLALFLLSGGGILFTHPKGKFLLVRGLLFVGGFLLLLMGLSFWERGGALGYLLLNSLKNQILFFFDLFSFSLFLIILGLCLLGIASGLKFFHLRTLLSFVRQGLWEPQAKDRSLLKAKDEPLKEIPKDTSHRLMDYVKKDPQKASLPPSPLRSSRGGIDPYQLPPLDLLYHPKTISQGLSIDEEALQENAKILKSVLNDYGVCGDIVGIHPGPVVTLYELEPAPGLKSSRVISLADDIARSMSAVSARVAVIPGKNVIGIELPNKIRETVHLRDLLASPAYEQSDTNLTLVLGKDISGTPVITDLARMPHLLIAGTTGSGKSVGVNAMILSLIYRLPPERCKFIMIDPKMLELSVYDGIPHLLAPVVIEPKKAITALRWVVREMESRYQAMSKLSVRNIEGFNKRILETKARGEIITRQVQTGFDPETGKPVFEEQPLPMDPLPFIVVVVDEMADLMLVAGKEIESAVQRLSQMARAAGIHLIMATQRPSVDVITGTIKANFPTRISFQVTSKIDSRTILGEQGAEQLLGQGDMLYMAAGGRISRVHGPYVGDTDVEKVVQCLKAQSEPSYIEEITVDLSSPDPKEGEGKDEEDDLYQEALALIYRERKASTSFIQRHLKIGYNRAARLIEKMEEDGLVSAPNHVGKREVLANGRQEI